MCCGYGTDGKKNTWGYDCLIVPGAAKQKTTGTRLQNSVFCGNNFATMSGLVNTAVGMTTNTICSKYMLTLESQCIPIMGEVFLS